MAIKTNTNRSSIFISHRATDAAVVDMLKDFLAETDIPNERIFCSSLPGNDVNQKISEEVKQRLKGSAINILIISNRYYESAYCLNEAGVAWYLDQEAKVIPIGLPEITHDKMIGFIGSDYKLRRLDDSDDLSYIYDTVHERLNTNNVKTAIVTRAIKKLKDKHTDFLNDRKS